MQTITPEQVGQNVRFTVVATGYWDQSSYQAQNQFVLELHPVADNSKELIPGSGYKGELLSLSFQDVDVHVLLKSIASFTGLNVITSDSVKGTLTLHLSDVPWDQALDIIMQARGLAADRNGNVLWIAPREEIDRIQQGRMQSEHDNESLAPLRTRVFQLNYAKSDAILSAINAGQDGANGVRSTSLLSERGSIIVDPRTNKLIVTDTPNKLENLAGVIDQIDIPVRQVMIEARIVEATDGWGRNLGMRLSGTMMSGNWAAGGTMPMEDDSKQDENDDGSNDMRGKVDQFNFFNLMATPSGAVPGYFGFKFNRNRNEYLQLELQALETENYGRNIASPSLTTQDSVKAYVEQGVEIPYLEASASGATSITFRKAVLGLEVTPTITPDGTVELKILVSQDSPDSYMDYGVSIKTNRVNTQVTVENGGTIVIGGIFKEQEYTRTQKIPLLGDIPLIGQFFRSTNRLHERTELLVFITPRIIDDGFVRGGTAIPNLGR
ncbi:MAG: type IV pilus secretin PilQ, partial [Saezia sp.]